MVPDRSDLIELTGRYVREVFSDNTGDLMIAHDFKHVHRVRNRAVFIAVEEKYPDLEMVEITALLHDIGLSRMSGDETGKRQAHGPLGADMARQFLQINSSLSPGDIELITDTVRHHSDPPKIMDDHISDLGDRGNLLEIITDADRIDALGAVGIMRACTSKYFLPDYDPVNVKGKSWGLSTSEFLMKSGVDSVKVPPVENIIEQINQQIRYYDSLHTGTAKKLAKPMVEYMKGFILQLEKELS
jgi:hypothetical protein